MPTFRGDDSYGISLATNHLISLGHRTIAMVGGTDQTSTGRDRYQGYVNALRKAGIEVDPNLRIPGARSKQGGFEAAVNFLSRRTETDSRRLLERPRRHRPDERRFTRRLRAGQGYFRDRL